MESNKPLVSVIMPCYNAMPFLTEALESIIKQTYQNLEIILIDDGSVDLTAVILEHYAKVDKRVVHVVNESNLGLIETLNKGIRLAKGAFIARMDADDISEPSRIEILLKEIVERNADVISCASILIDKSGKSISSNPVRATKPISCAFFSFFGPPVLHPGVLVRSDLLKKELYKKTPSTIHTEDYELWGRLVRQGKNIINSEKYLLKYRISDQSISRKFEATQITNFVESAYQHYESYYAYAPKFSAFKVMVNRIDKFVSPLQLIAGFILISRTKWRFLKFQKTISSKEKNEIKVIVREQKLDVLIQSFKKGSLFVKLTAFLLLVFMFPLLILKKRLREYFQNKIKYNLKTKINF